MNKEVYEMSETDLMSNVFQVFLRESPQYSKAWMEAVQKMDSANVREG